jgi:hypothetical protein
MSHPSRIDQTWLLGKVKQQETTHESGPSIWGEEQAEIEVE